MHTPLSADFAHGEFTSFFFVVSAGVCRLLLLAFSNFPKSAHQQGGDAAAPDAGAAVDTGAVAAVDAGATTDVGAAVDASAPAGAGAAVDAGEEDANQNTLTASKITVKKQIVSNIPADPHGVRQFFRAIVKYGKLPADDVQATTRLIWSYVEPDSDAWQ